MKKTIEVKHKVTRTKVSFSLELPASVEEALALYGEECVINLVQEQVKKRASAVARNMLAYGHKPEVVAERMEKEWSPVSRLRKKSVLDLDALTPDDIREIL